MKATFGEISALIVFVACVAYVAAAQIFGYAVEEAIAAAITLSLGYLFGSRTSSPT